MSEHTDKGERANAAASEIAGRLGEYAAKQAAPSASASLDARQIMALSADEFIKLLQGCEAYTDLAPVLCAEAARRLFAPSHVASPNDCVRSTPEHVRDHADQHELSARANVEERDDVKKLLKAMDVDSVEEALAVVEHEQWLRSTKPSATRDTKAKGLPDYPLKPVAGCKWPGCDCPGRWDCNATTERGAKNG
jgi:hypothetical protein